MFKEGEEEEEMEAEATRECCVLENERRAPQREAEEEHGEELPAYTQCGGLRMTTSET